MERTGQTFQELLWERLRAEDVSQADFAARLGVGQATLSRWLRGENVPANWRTRRHVAQMLAIAPSDLDALIDAQQMATQPANARPLELSDILLLPLHGFVPAGRPDIIERDNAHLVALLNLTDDARAWLAREIKNPQAVIAIGNSMSGWVESGSVVIFDPDARASSGDIVVAVVAGETTLKQIFRTDEATILRSTNPDKFPDLSIRDENGGYVLGVVRMALPPLQPQYFGISPARARR